MKHSSRVANIDIAAKQTKTDLQIIPIGFQLNPVCMFEVMRVMAPPSLSLCDVISCATRSPTQVRGQGPHRTYLAAACNISQHLRIEENQGDRCPGLGVMVRMAQGSWRIGDGTGPHHFWGAEVPSTQSDCQKEAVSRYTICIYSIYYMILMCVSMCCYFLLFRYAKYIV